MKKLFAKLKPNKKNKGFSLLEVMLAICILALIATPIFNSIAASYRLNLKSRKMLASTDILTSMMDYAASKTYNSYKYKDATKTEVEVKGLADIYTNNGTPLKCGAMYYVYPGSEYIAVGCSGNSSKMSFSDVEYNGYHFDVVVSMNLPTSTDKYYTGTFKVQVFDHSELDADGNKVKYAESTTRVANTLV